MSKQGVTGAYSSPIARGTNRNALRAPVPRIPRDQVYAAAETGQHCGQCGAPLAPDAPVWRTHCTLGPAPLGGRISAILALVCVECRPGWNAAETVATACAVCRRTVNHRQRNAPWRQRPDRPLSAYCSERCRWGAANRRRRDTTAAQRQRTCATCGQPFTPPRADGRYCSHACRQRAYRQRRAS
jgi:hypothetical protein